MTEARSNTQAHCRAVAQASNLKIADCCMPGVIANTEILHGHIERVHAALILLGTSRQSSG